MELRHLRYFIAVSEEGSFVRAARRLRVAQPALSKQIRDLEGEVGVALFQRLPRGVELTQAGDAFLVEARSTLDGAARAVHKAQSAAEHRACNLYFAHGELAACTAPVEHLLAAFRDAYPDVHVRVTSADDAETHDAVRERRVDVGCVFVAAWPVEGFCAHRLLDCPITGVLLPAKHPLAAKPVVRLEELGALTWLHSAPRRWPGFMRTLEGALRDRGLVPERRCERSSHAPSANMQIAAGDTWALASEAVGAPYRAASTAIAYRPLVKPPIPCWLAMVWRAPGSPAVQRLVDVAHRIGLRGGGAASP